MANEPVIKKIVREVVREELNIGLDFRFSKFEEKILKYFEDFRSDMTKLQDRIVGELKTNREEQALLNGRTAKINEIDNRVEKLEKIHPKGAHNFASV